MTTRAEILKTDSPLIKRARIVIDAPVERVFALVANPHQHHLFDGSGTVLGSIEGPEALTLGSRFSMSMKIKVPYRIANIVKEYRPNELIAWSHFSGHRWRYEFQDLGSGRTEVTETFDGTYARIPLVLRLMNALPKNEIAIAKTLVRLKAIAEKSG
jgi:uncharacterized protein YndB with AHSA1/START domain